MSPIFVLPLDVLRIIQICLSQTEYRRLLNTNKTNFELLKEESVNYELVLTSQNAQFLIFTDFSQKVSFPSCQVSLKVPVLFDAFYIFLKRLAVTLYDARKLTLGSFTGPDYLYMMFLMAFPQLPCLTFCQSWSY
jgi:hypothetical protein